MRRHEYIFTGKNLPGISRSARVGNSYQKSNKTCTRNFLKFYIKKRALSPGRY